MQSRKKSLLAVILSIAIAVTFVLPANAASDFATGNDLELGDAFKSNLTAPLSFDGSSAESSEVEVHNATTVYDLEVMQSPAPVTTSMTNGASGTLTLITADQYFYTSNYTVTNGAWYMAELQNFYSGRDTGANYSVRIGKTSGIKTSATNAVVLPVQSSGVNGYISGDISSLVTSNSANLYIAVFDGAANLLYYTSGPISTLFVYDTTVTVDSGKYVYSSNVKMSLQISVPDRLSSTADYEVDLLDGNGVTVAKALDGLSYTNADTKYNQETRFNSVFGNYFSSGQYYGGRIYTSLYFLHKLAAGVYNVRITDGTTPNTYQDLVTVVDAPVVYNFYDLSSNGFAPPVIGGNTVYTVVDADGAGLNDFTGSVVNASDSTLGTSSSARYYQGNLYYKVTLNSGTFENSQTYRIKLTYNGNGNIYYSPETVSGLNGMSDFNIYDVSFAGEKNQADFILKTVNPPTGTITLGLFSSANYQTPLLTADVTAGSSIPIKFTEVGAYEPLMLDSGSYAIGMKVNVGGGYSYWRNLYNFYVSPNQYGSSSANPEYYNMGPASY